MMRRLPPRGGWSRDLAREWAGRFVASLSTPGLLTATLFFAASLTPSLLPRTWGMQGVLSGFSLAAGYGMGVLALAVWRYLELPLPGPRTHRVLVLSAASASLAAALLFLWSAAEWQNSIRLRMDLEPVDSADPFRVGAVALLVAVSLLLVGRLFQIAWRTIARRLGRFLPRRVANVAGGALAIALFWSVGNGVLVQRAIRGLDASFQQVDALMERGLAPPDDPSRTGSAASLVAWHELGRRGREFVAATPTAAEVEAFFARAGAAGPVEGEGRPLAPLRVYVGLNSAATIEERARLALDELIRVGGFERSVLVLATPTGTGWLDPGAIRAVEYLHRGDVATVAVQYSYLASWLSLMAEAEYGVETARAVFARVYGHWKGLPREARPRLYLHGLSLGALNSERSADFYDFIGDPFQGALWSGPPFRSTTWRVRTDQREPGSPAWLPRFRDGAVVRFTNQENHLDLPGAAWGPIRIVYLQYASDPITFFETRSLYRQPEWMSGPRGPDVSPALRWYPVVTMLQLAVDMAAADQAPTGYGHVYAPEHYVDAWLAVSDPAGWSAEEVARLKAWLGARDD